MLVRFILPVLAAFAAALPVPATRAISALTALQMGVDLANPTAGALVQLYQSARNAILDCVTRFDARTLQAIRQDFTEIREAMLRSIPA